MKRLLAILLAALWALAAARPAAAQAPTADLAAWVGVPVAQVTLEAPEGGLPRENLEPLLRAQQGQPLDLGDVRLDVALLFRAGDFAAVEAIAEPWFEMAPDGTIEDAVRLIYRVRPPPRLDAVEVEGAKGEARRVARRALDLVAGDALYNEADLSGVELRARTELRAQGWPMAEVRAAVRIDEDGRRALVLDVDAGPPEVWGEITLVGPEVLGEGRARRCRLTRPGCRPHVGRFRRILRRHGVVEGRRVVRAELDRALTEMKEELASLGWFNARVSLQTMADAGLVNRPLIHLEGQRRLSVSMSREGRGGRLPRPGEVQPVLGLYDGARATASTADEVRRRLEGWLDERGYGDAEVSVALREDDQGHVLDITARTGPQLVLRRVEVQGAETFTPRYLAGAMREADEEGLDENVVSTKGVERGLEGLREFYRGQGFLEAEVALDRLERSRARLPGLRTDRRRVTVHVDVFEGQRTRLVELRSEGIEVGEPGFIAVSTAREEQVGEPYRSAKLDALARTVSDAWRARGHLGADVQVETRVSEDGAFAHALLRVEPGPQVRLRSVVVQGNRRTRRTVIERELAVTVGEPITPDGLRDTRTQLYDLDLFRVVSPELVGDDDRFRDLLILLDEKPNLLFETGGSLSTDQGVRVNGRATHRNLGGLGHKVTLLGQVGYGWFGDEWRFDLDQPVWQAALRYTAPHIPTTGQQLVVEGILGETLQEPVYRLWRSGGAVGVRTTLARWEAFVGYRAQLRRLEDIEVGALVQGDPWLELLGLEEDGTGRARLPSASRLVTGPTFVLVRDGRNDRFNPTRGSFLTGSMEVTDGLAQSFVTARGLVRAEQLVPVGPLTLNLGVRLGGGWAQGSDVTLPIEERFYLGGSGSLRGFQLNTVGPANFAGRPDVPFPDELESLIEGSGIRGNTARWVPTGGDALLSGTVEVRVPLTALGFADLDSAQWVVFTDVGQVGFLSPALLPTSARQDLDQLVRKGLGTGIRVSTPVGPAALDLGFNPWPQVERDEPAFVAHLSLGEL